MAIKVNGTTVIDDSRNLVNIASGLGGSPAGSIVYHAANTAPSGYVKANGAAVSRTTYSDLFTAIGTTYGSGDGSTTFNVPDLRGEFLRGWDDSRGVDSGRTFGSAQADELESHNHVGGFSRISDYNYSVGLYGQRTDPYAGTHSGQGSANGVQVRAYTSDTGGTETRPRNIALLACIKY